MAAQKRRAPVKKQQGITVRNFLPDDLPIHHIDHTSVVHIEGKFYVTLLQLQMPLISSDEEILNLKVIPSKAVARVVMDEKTLESHIELLALHLKRVRVKVEKAKKDDANADGTTDVRTDAETSG